MSRSSVQYQTIRLLCVDEYNFMTIKNYISSIVVNVKSSDMIHNLWLVRSLETNEVLTIWAERTCTEVQLLNNKLQNNGVTYMPFSDFSLFLCMNIIKILLYILSYEVLIFIVFDFDNAKERTLNIYFFTSLIMT